ncbi:hypothetical protein B0H66DRAFT_603540 [Apodospora peruviana]|uniref:HNH nuclease domain-containing protein n=1 Tax=Apodospora peruviana TaxID=516989 RepID=A0AAE0M4T2_9PEZI|nr:hypothetical protein B0H66DRAFT_603540 [Apodospora peruviana]
MLAVKDWLDNGEERSASWLETNEARRISEQAGAAYFECRIYMKQAERVNQGGYYLDKWSVGAVHLFPYKLDSDVLISLFGEDVEGDLIAARNGLLLQKDVESAFIDDIAIVIVPDLPDNPTAEEFAGWEGKEPKDCRWHIIDEDAESLDAIVVPENGVFTEAEHTAVRDLDGHRLSFTNDNRPAARYLYLLFVVAQLRMAWRHRYIADRRPMNPTPTVGKGIMEIGRYDTSFQENIMSPLPGTDHHDTQAQRYKERDDGEIDLLAIAKIIAAQRRGDEEEDE